MLNIDPIVTPQSNTPAFKSKTTCEKLAKQKLSRLAEQSKAQLLKTTDSCCIPTTKKMQIATDYLANEAAKTTSSKMAAEKQTKLTQDFVV